MAFEESVHKILYETTFLQRPCALASWKSSTLVFTVFTRTKRILKTDRAAWIAGPDSGGIFQRHGKAETLLPTTGSGFCRDLKSSLEEFSGALTSDRTSQVVSKIL